ncbi:MAG: 8-amino-7-oxononanoate synthase [Planctomycetaceae bacterium]
MRKLPWLADDLQQRANDGLLRRRRETRWLPDGWCEIDGRRVSNFIANDYLNLAGDPRVVHAAETALRQSGLGARASALLGGRSDWHVRLERRLADFEGQDAAILFPTGLAANLGTVSALVSEHDAVFSDRLNHASLIDGCRLSKARVQIYRHDELDTLDRILGEAHDRPRRWIVTDGAFSMDGDLAPLPDLCDLAERHRAELIVDEAHATGVFGNTGRGTAEHFGVEDRIAVRIGTLSKALGALGGFVTGSQTLIDYLWNAARTQVFSTALPPAVCAAAEAAVTIVQQEPGRIARLHELSNFLRTKLATAGVEVLAGSTGPIIPIVLNDPQRAVAVANRLEDRGFLVGAIRPPTVPRGTSRLRISVSTAHAESRLDELATALAGEWRR